MTPPYICAGEIVDRRGALVHIRTDCGLTWVDPVRIEPHAGGTVRVVGRLVPPGEMRREPMARAAS